MEDSNKLYLNYKIYSVPKTVLKILTLIPQPHKYLTFKIK